MHDHRLPLSGQRGPADHSVRDQIIRAAREYFRRYGYSKTTVSDLARAIGFSKAYIYKFFDSKQAIGEAICAATLRRIADQAARSVVDGESAAAKLRRLFDTITAASIDLFFSERQLYDIAAHSAAEKWPSSTNHQAEISGILVGILREGRESGEFEGDTPLEEQSRAIMLVMQPFANPLLLQHALDLAPVAQKDVADLVLRSLSP